MSTRNDNGPALRAEAEQTGTTDQTPGWAVHDRPTRRSPQPYDEELLVRLLADGGKTYSDIAGEVGLSRSMVGKIARGEYRSDLTGRVRRVRFDRAQSLQHIALRWAQQAMYAQIREGLEGKGETARRCREFIITAAQKYDMFREAAREVHVESTIEQLQEAETFLAPLNACSIADESKRRR